MAIDRSKIQRQADAHMAAGKVERAIDELLKLLEDNPRDHAMMNRIGDAYLQIQREPEAVDMFKRAAAGYEREGFSSRAAAVFKKAHRHAPEDEDAATRLAELYRQTNLIKEAMQIHIKMADAFTKKGLLKRALTEFGKVVELDPKNLKNKVKLADLYNKEGMKDKAAAIYLEVAETLAMEGMHAEATQVMERARAMTSTPQVFLTWSRLCVVQKNLDEAARVLREGGEANPRSPELLEALAEVEIQRHQPDQALEALGQVPQLPEKALAVCERAMKELVRASRAADALRLFRPIAQDFARRGAGERAGQALRTVLLLAPTLEGWLLMAEMAHQSGQKEERIQALQQAFALAQDADDEAQVSEIGRILNALGVTEERFRATDVPAPTPAPPPRTEATDVDLHRRFRLDQMRKQAEDYERSRFPDRASEIYQQILEEDPYAMDALERMAEIIKASGRLAAVQQHYLKHAEKLVQLNRGDLASALLDQAEKLFPGSTRMHRRMWGLPDAGAPRPAAPAPMPAAEERIPVIPLGAGLPVPPPPAVPLPVPAAELPEGLDDLDILIALDETAAGTSAQRPLPPPPPPLPAALPTIPLALDAGELGAAELGVEDLGGAELPELEPLELEPLPFAEGKAPVVPAAIPAPLGSPLPPPIPLPPPPAPAPLDEELASLLSDIDFQLDYGSAEEAKIELENALNRWPEHPELRERMERAEQRLRQLGHQARPAAAAEDQDFSHTFFDLTDVLGGALGESEGEGEEMHDATNVVEKIQSVEELFSAFRDGVEQQVRGDDFDTHYNLGIAYKEMMLIEPAMEEFKKAMRDPERTLECCSMLSICEQSQGNLEAAVAWLHQGIEAPGFPPEDAIGLQYDLGEILLQMGRPEEAREAFRQVQALDPEYRDVARKL